MNGRILLPLLLTFLFVRIDAQTFDPMTTRTIDGSNNNLDHPTWGAVGDLLRTVTPLTYADSIAAPSGTDRPNPREISNAIFSQTGLLSDPGGLSDFCWVWGQFIDHDIGLTPDGNEPMMIPIPPGDPWFDPMAQGSGIIPILRNLWDTSTGTGPDNPRRHPNVITAFIDGSGVYGSNQEMADYLRSFSGGKLRVSQGNMPPFNTDTGEFDGVVDPSAPHMDNPVGITDKVYVAGDVRANENPVLLAFHTLFVREHNRLCDKLVEEHPDWDDEQLYQHARRLVSGLIQSIVYDEWLPAMGVMLPPYAGYDPEINPQAMNIFTAAAFRVGHTLLNGNLLRLDNEGNVIPQGNLPLRAAFFNPLVVLEAGGLDPFFKGMAVQTQQNFDSKVIDDVRNFLFGPPGAGGLDLGSINIERGRDRGLPRYQYFQQINPNAAVFSTLLMLYADIDNIDPWVGMLAEKRMPGALFGETIRKVMEVQFAALRDGDRFYYENDPVLTPDEKAWIRDFTMHDIVMKNTGVELMQNEVFKAMPHSEICDNLLVDVSGLVKTEAGAPVENVYAALQIGTAYEESFTDTDGSFVFPPSPGCQVNGLSLFRDDNVVNGVTTLDLILIQKHILGISTLGSPYKLIAADADKSGHISTFDLIRIRRVILGLDDAFEGNTSWRFVESSYQFSDPADPFADDFPDAMDFNLLGADLEVTFTGIKVGDVNGSASPTVLLAESEVDERSNPVAWQLVVADRELKAGQTYQVVFNAGALAAMEGFQFGLRLDPAAVELTGVYPGALPGLSDGNFGLFGGEGIVTTSWHRVSEAGPAEGELFTLVLRARRDVNLRSVLTLDGSKTAPAAYDAQEQGRPVELVFTEAEFGSFRLYQNRPNPFAGATVIPFELPAEGDARLRVYDLSGRTLLLRTGTFAAGYNEWTIEGKDLPGTGFYFYEVESDYGTESRKMLRQ